MTGINMDKDKGQAEAEEETVDQARQSLPLLPLSRTHIIHIAEDRHQADNLLGRRSLRHVARRDVIRGRLWAACKRA